MGVNLRKSIGRGSEWTELHTFERRARLKLGKEVFGGSKGRLGRRGTKI